MRTYSSDTLKVMERRGSITTEMRQAGENFRALFNQAQLDPLKAADMNRIPGGPKYNPTAVSTAAAAARDKVWNTIQTLGGLQSPAGSCIWHVIGLEQSLKEWALIQGWNGRLISQEVASGILIAALGVLRR